MITLITGGPGTGKTAWLVSQLLQLQIQQPHRRLLAHGIKEFKLSHKQIFCRNNKCEMCASSETVQQSLKLTDPIEFNKINDLLFVEDWPEWKRINDLIVIDEAQRAWKSKAGLVMDSIALLDTHRHAGIDFWLLTQSPKLLHIDVRVMVTRHIHLLANWRGRTQFEWSEVSDNVQSTQNAVQRSYKLPSEVYRYYKSAEVHTVQEKRKPLSFYLMIVAAVFAVVVVTFAVVRVKMRATKNIEKETVSESKQFTAGTFAPALESAQGGVKSSEPLTKEQFYAAYTPVAPGVPWSAPAYQELAKPRVMPILVGCIISKKTDDQRCNCYTQQGTLIALDYASCAYQIDHRVFNPFKDENKSNFSNSESAHLPAAAALIQADHARDNSG